MRFLLLNLAILFLASSGFSGAAFGQEQLTGVWLQKLLVNGKWKNAGTFEVRSDARGELSMTSKSQSHSAELINSKGITNVQHAGDVWTFDSDWGNGNIGNFVLKADGPGRFVGYPYLNGQKLPTLNLWLRTKQQKMSSATNDPVKHSPEIRAEAQTAKSKPKSMTIAGTRWTSSEKKGLSGDKMTFDTTVTFNADGKTFSMLQAITGGGIRGSVHHSSGTYRQSGNDIIVRLNSGTGLGSEHVFNKSGSVLTVLKWHDVETQSLWEMHRID